MYIFLFRGKQLTADQLKIQLREKERKAEGRPAQLPGGQVVCAWQGKGGSNFHRPDPKSLKSFCGFIPLYR